jgi:hypothetical protein
MSHAIVVGDDKRVASPTTSSSESINLFTPERVNHQITSAFHDVNALVEVLYVWKGM